MCGICGFSWDDNKLIVKMADSINYRGPDDSGFYTDKDISLGHRRLSIIDLNPRGRNPIHNEDDTIQVIFNGEIYNFELLRKELEKKGHKFYTNTDTEVIVHSYEEYGENCVKKFNGMFAFALWDSEKKKLFLARDRLGIKPLFYYFDGSRIIFASEIKAILECGIKRQANYETLFQMARFLFPLGDDTLFKGIKEILPAHFLAYSKGKLKIQQYWTLPEKLENEKIIADELERLLLASVKRMLIADVPLGATLSGGIDSSLIVAMMSKMSSEPVKTFTSGYGYSEDEFEHAKRIADEFGTDHHEITIPYKKITKSVPEIIWHMENIVTRTSTFPAFFFSKELRKFVTVALVGEGGDELYGGYPRYNRFAPHKINETSEIYKEIPMSFFSERDVKTIFNFSEGFSKNSQDVVMTYVKNAKKNNALNKVLNFEIEKELSGVHLWRVDRMTMAHSIEARVPYLDHTVVELAARTPAYLKINPNGNKYILKKIASKYLPKENIERRKLGLGTPLSEWFKEDFSELLPHILSEEKISRREYMNYAPIKKLLRKRKIISRIPFTRMLPNRAERFVKEKYLGDLWFLCMIELWYRMFIEMENPEFKIEKLIS